ncbi:hypothetical protein D9758_004184 [Tetrapyrgos nigripes]|uniref:Peptidase A1 domain-containing protein n=1 Tax=Tetrapyrgos nigripes TaxID=182062 RepID=A0A8H5LVW3_9AGAR|nr:hypothetical protein D9758_004184 [Tetrapyrgos nigripes]
MIFPKATLFAYVSLALSLQVTAGPVPESKRSQGVGIPLRRHAGLQTEDGLFDLNKAVARMTRTQNKHTQNLINFQANKGYLPFTGAKIGSFLKVEDLLDIDLDLSLGKRQSVPLFNQEDIEWLGPVSIGSNNQEFTIDFDTGSADFWIVSRSCNDTVCTSKHTYDFNASTTAQEQSGNFSIHYGDGSTASGDLFTDSVTVAGVTAKDQFFAAVRNLSGTFDNDPIDGILGLAYPPLSKIKQDPFFTTANTQGAVPSNQFSFYFSSGSPGSNDSELFLGGTNPDLYTGDFDNVDVEGDKGYWSLGGASVSVNGKKAVDGLSTIIDSGTTIMYGPPDAVKELYAKVNGSQEYSAARGLWSYPCATPPNITFNWGGKDWPIKGEHLNLGHADNSGENCVGSIAGQELNLGDNVWLLGNTFMKNVYTTFNFDTNQVGFAELKQ